MHSSRMCTAHCSGCLSCQAHLPIATHAPLCQACPTFTTHASPLLCMSSFAMNAPIVMHPPEHACPPLWHSCLHSPHTHTLPLPHTHTHPAFATHTHLNHVHPLRHTCLPPGRQAPPFAMHVPQHTCPLACMPPFCHACPHACTPPSTGKYGPPVNRMTDRCKNITLSQLHCGPLLFIILPTSYTAYLTINCFIRSNSTIWYLSFRI